jgi:DNA-binding transcriptional LysR family regulator
MYIYKFYYIILFYIRLNFDTFEKDGNMNLRQLYYFKKSAELQHFTKTASELFISQPSLSYAVSSLENELGTALFQKQGRNVVLTKSGKEFYPYIETALQSIEAGVALLKQRSVCNTGKIDIGTVPALAGDFVSQIIHDYMTISPDISFNLLTNDTKNIIPGIKSGIYDIGFCSKIDNEDELEFVPVLTQEIVVIFKNDHELAKRKKFDLSALKDYPLITYHENIPIGQTIRNILYKNNITPKIKHTFDDEASIAGMVSRDFGIAIVVNTPLLKLYNFSIMPLPIPIHPRVVYLAYLNERSHTEIVSNFIDFILKNNYIDTLKI